MKPILFVAFQLAVLTFIFVTQIRRNPSAVYRGLFLAAFLGVVGFDIWYLANYAYPTGFSF
jgi:hypothetical protein